MGFETHNRYQREYYERRDKTRMRPSFSPYCQRQIDRVIRAADLSTDQRILEVGCGQGRYTLPLLDLGFDITGVDLSPVLLDRMRAYRPERSEWSLVAADIANVREHVSGEFDRAIGFFTLHHMHDLQVALRGLVSVLRPGARIAFCEPNPYNPLYYFQIAFTPGMTWKGDRGIVEMRKRVVFSALQAAGFSDLGWETFGFFPPFVANRRGAGSVEGLLERIAPLRPALPFQIFSARLAE